MTRILLVFLCLPIALSAQDNFTFEHGGLTRDYILYLPDDLPADAPLVFVLHGYTSNANIIMSYCGMNSQADLHGFAVCYPQGTTDQSGITHWNARLSISTADDIGFLSELALYLQQEHELNPDHTFVCGMSNGGFMSYTLACERPDVFKAIASVTGTMSGYTWNNCDPVNPVPVFQISGLDDDVVPVDGSMDTAGGWGGAPDMETVNDFWKDLNACSESTTVSLSDDLQAVYHANGLNGNEVWLYPIDNWGHSWPGFWAQAQTGIIAAEEIWEFFSLVVNQPVSSLAGTPLPELLLYPNPVSETLWIDAPDYREGKYAIYNILGQLVGEGVLAGTSVEIPVADLAPGTHVLLWGKDRTMFQKL